MTCLLSPISYINDRYLICEWNRKAAQLKSMAFPRSSSKQAEDRFVDGVEDGVVPDHCCHEKGTWFENSRQPTVLSLLNLYSTSKSKIIYWELFTWWTLLDTKCHIFLSQKTQSRQGMYVTCGVFKHDKCIYQTPKLYLPYMIQNMNKYCCYNQLTTSRLSKTILRSKGSLFHCDDQS